MASDTASYIAREPAPRAVVNHPSRTVISGSPLDAFVIRFPQHLDSLLYGSEEHHAFFSLIDRGYRVVYTSDAVARHPYPRTMQELRARHLHDLAAATAYMTLMFAETRYRGVLARYVYEALKGTPRAWRREPTTSHPRIVPRWRMLLALLSGPLLYARSRLHGSRQRACSLRTPPSGSQRARRDSAAHPCAS